MDLAARAAERLDASQTDTPAASPRARPDASAGPTFAPLLDRASARTTAGLIGAWRGDGYFHLFVPPLFDAHALAWRLQPGRRAKISEPVPLAALQGDDAWRATLLPHPGMAERPTPVSGLAVVDSDGLRARYEFT
jgi:hypothetical protein